MTVQIQRWCVICAGINYIERHFPDEVMARVHHDRLIADDVYEPHEIYVAKVTIAWDDENRVLPKVEGE